MTRLLGVLCACVTLLAAWQVPVSAQSAQIRSVIDVTPSFLDVRLTEITSAATMSILLRNDASVPLIYRPSLSAVDDASGSLVPTVPLSGSLAESLILETGDVSLEPGQSADISLRLINSATLSPGGHYAAVLIAVAGAEDGSQLSIKQAVSVPIFISKEGGEITELKLTSLKSNGKLFSLPSSVHLDVKNSGNVHSIPRASIILRSSGKEEVLAKGTFNAESRVVLPGKSLSEDVQIRLLGTVNLPGHYSLTAQYRPDGVETPEELVVEFWYIPPFYVLLSFAVGWAVVWKVRSRYRIRQHRSTLAQQRSPRAGTIRAKSGKQSITVLRSTTPLPAEKSETLQK